MYHVFQAHLARELERIRGDGFYKSERVIVSPQRPQIELASGTSVLNFCANNYLGLADDPRLVQAAKDGVDEYGFGMASVRFICGTQSVHKELEHHVVRMMERQGTLEELVKQVAENNIRLRRLEERNRNGRA